MRCQTGGVDQMRRHALGHGGLITFADQKRSRRLAWRFLPGSNIMYLIHARYRLGKEMGINMGLQVAMCSSISWCVMMRCYF